jgi:peroxiredoxin
MSTGDFGTGTGDANAEDAFTGAGDCVSAPDEAKQRGRNAWFLRILLIASVVVLVLGAWRWFEARQQRATLQSPGFAPAAGTQAAAFTLPAPDGSTMSLADFKGKVVLLNFWATWCPPCKAEMPDLQALHDEYGASRGFAVLGVNMMESREPVNNFAILRNLTFPIVLDEDGMVSAQRFGVRGLPTSIIVDRDGRIIDSWNGQLSKKEMLSRLEKVW